ncbi:MAG: Hsp20/alpha crystallin family protein [Leptospiraceae bacterium]|nr:Hsp20/alpha crystallin family protein [Leptospiraceae bacterium]MDW7976184.1 Hsp20/alpha crystallin family protein [Leptospiraceae bacterium]
MSAVVKKELEGEKVEKAEKRNRYYIPPVDIYENNNEYILFAEMPGVNEDDVDITIEKNILTIHAKVNFTAPEGYRLFYSEYGIGDYKRSFELGNEIDQDKIEATIKNGVLKLVLPKIQPSVKKIQIKSI